MAFRGLTGWKPFRIIPLDADTGKPLDTNIGRKTYVTYYDIKKDKSGAKSIVAHRSPSGSVVVGAEGKGGSKDVKNNDGDKKNAKDGVENAGGGSWTSEEDAQLKALKAEGKTWAQIIEVMGRDKGQLAKRFKEIKDDDSGETKKNDGEKKGGKNGVDGEANNASGGNNNEQKKKTKAEKKEERAAAAKAEGEKKKAAAMAEKTGSKDKAKATATNAKAPSAVGTNRSGQARFTMNEWQTLQEDSLFSFGELQCLSELIMRDQSQTWLRIAAAFYDKTGRRVHPEDIREKFESMAGMG